MQTINLSIRESYFSARIKTRPKFTEKDSTFRTELWGISIQEVYF